MVVSERWEIGGVVSGEMVVLGFRGGGLCWVVVISTSATHDS
jgi:hypothetical protein